jgi:hypothetical protein
MRQPSKRRTASAEAFCLMAKSQIFGSLERDELLIEQNRFMAVHANDMLLRSNTP